MKRREDVVHACMHAHLTLLIAHELEHMEGRILLLAQRNQHVLVCLARAHTVTADRTERMHAGWITSMLYRCVRMNTPSLRSVVHMGSVRAHMYKHRRTCC